MDRERRLILSESYKRDGTSVVTVNHFPSGEPLPLRDELPNESILESLRELTTLTKAFILVLTTAMVGGLGFAVFATTRSVLGKRKAVP